MRLWCWLALLLIVTKIIPRFTASYARIHFWTLGLYGVVLVVTAIIAFVLPSVKEVRAKLPRWVRWLIVASIVAALVINSVRVSALEAKTLWMNRAAAAITGVRLDVLRSPLPLSEHCKDKGEECKQLQEGWANLGKNTTNELDQAVKDQNITLSAMKKDNAQPTAPVPPGLKPHGNDSGVICASSKIGACAIVGAAAIACMVALPEAWSGCLAGAMALLGILGSDKDASGLSAQSSRHVGETVAKALTDKGADPTVVLKPLADEPDPKAMRVAQKAIEELAKQGLIPAETKDPLITKLTSLATTAETSLIERCQRDLVTTATQNGTTANWCAVKLRLTQSEYCSRASLSGDQQKGIWTAVVNQTFTDDPSRQQALTTIAACP